MLPFAPLSFVARPRARRAIPFRIFAAAFFAVILIAPSPARAATLHDMNDAFAIDVDAPDMRACVLFPEDPQRQRACDGLDPDAIAEVTRAQAGAVGAALLIGEGWGFALVVRRAPSDGMTFDAEAAAAFARDARADVRGPNGAGLLGGTDARAELLPVEGCAVVARAGFAAVIGTDAPPVKRLLERQVVYGVAGRTSVFHLVIACDADHLALAEQRIRRMLPSVRIEPPLARPPRAVTRAVIGARLGISLVAIALAVAVVLGVRMKAKRARGVRGASASGWPSIRGDV